MSIPTIALDALGDSHPDLTFYSLGLADIYDEDRAGTPLTVLATRLEQMRAHAGETNPDYAAYLDGYDNALSILTRLQTTTNAAQARIAWEDREDQENHR